MKKLSPIVEEILAWIVVIGIVLFGIWAVSGLF